ncbi:MAG: response regulator transcription factor [Gammaproteobacteria bacterium]|nr:response regulator transcription factor [Gammaproteobacteria bacterium]
MSIRVLLVDDHQMVREGLRAVLERDEPRYAVVGEASSGREAVRLARSLQPDVIVMDVAMNDLNGIEATRQICAAEGAAPVVALSSYADRRSVKAILGAGASGYVLKANAYAELRQAIEAAVAGRKYLCSDVTNDIIETALEGGRGGGVSAYDLLGARELEVLQLLAEGLTSAEIAKRMSVAVSTVETHRRNIMKKLDIHSVAELTKYAIREGISSLEPSLPDDPASDVGAQQ